ncbi:nucleotidyltransferase domain-containing protein [Paenibacillus spongiae]|uniref:Nucleotidyltransferase domain-containing protein n=1 Tax=Paenibacillus spongiae TaxID=2909671 RepID=A0ABY5SGL3_9BACL|nr:nucleotidyltransferase domain-containing protein [Paenibacillus spongiae]UVI33122.1 nucleotidyltransferase domain-containing protein [Paenibacillus spongiae]
MLIDRKVKEVLDDYIKIEIEQHSSLEAIILCGSQATGMATAHSDIDLCYIGQFPSFKRVNSTYKDYDVQIMIAPWTWYEEVIRSFERKGNIGTITTMLAAGICLWSKRTLTSKWKELQDEAKRYYEAGPTPAAPEELIRMKRKIIELWNNYKDAHDEWSSIWLRNTLVQDCIEAHFIIQNWWAVKPKYLIRTLRERDPVLAVNLQECLGSNRESNVRRFAIMC